MHDLTVYTEAEPLGAAGFADVVRAVNIVTKESVALKKSRPSPDCVARTAREIYVQRRLLHGNIMPVLDWAEDGSWFVMPVARGDLGDIHDREPLNGAGLLRLVEDVGAALATAHRRGFVHRDLTPRNILWLRDRWVVSDWGFVRLPPGQARTPLTRTGVATECFTAPEVYRDGSTATLAADIYSLGRVVGWLLTGRQLEPGKPVALARDNPWADFVIESTREDPAERPQTMDAALRLLSPVFANVDDAIPALPSDGSPEIDVVNVVINAFKVLLQDPMRQIQLEELIDRETESAFALLNPERFPVQTLVQGNDLEMRLERYVESCRLLMDLLICACAYGTDAQTRLWTKAIRRIGRPSGDWGGNTAMLALRRFPTTLTMYAGALSAIARGHWENYRAVTLDPVLETPNDREAAPAVVRACSAMVLEHAHARTLPNKARFHTPVSDWLYERLREPLRPIIRDDQDYEQVFDRVEYVFAMLVAAYRRDDRVPLGRFAWRSAESRRFSQKTVGDSLQADIERLGDNWGPIRAGVFQNRSEAMNALEFVEIAIGSRHWA